MNILVCVSAIDQFKYRYSLYNYYIQ